MIKKSKFLLMKAKHSPFGVYTHSLELFIFPDYKATPKVGDPVKHWFWVLIKYDTLKFRFFKSLKGLAKFKIFLPTFKMFCGRGKY